MTHKATPTVDQYTNLMRYTQYFMDLPIVRNECTYIYIPSAMLCSTDYICESRQ